MGVLRYSILKFIYNYFNQIAYITTKEKKNSDFKQNTDITFFTEMPKKEEITENWIHWGRFQTQDLMDLAHFLFNKIRNSTAPLKH